MTGADSPTRNGRRWLVLFVGLGSIGRRHLGMLREIAEVDALCLRSGRGAGGADGTRELDVREFMELDPALALKPDFAVIANPTSLHVAAALDLARAGIPFLIEKPVSDRIEGLDELSALVAARKLPVMVGFQMRQHPGFLRLHEMIAGGEIGEPLNLQGHVGQYLPDWHPDSDYRKGYSARRTLGGGVILDLCHEIDIAIAVMGKPARVSCMAGRCSSLDIDTEDTAEISMEHGGARLSHVHLDYLERGYQWTTRVMGNSGSILWDAGGGFVELSDAGGRTTRWENPPGFSRDDLFREQMRRWLAVLEGRAEPEVGLGQGVLVTRVALAARASSEAKHQVEIAG